MIPRNLTVCAIQHVEREIFNRCCRMQRNSHTLARQFSRIIVLVRSLNRHRIIALAHRRPLQAVGSALGSILQFIVPIDKPFVYDFPLAAIDFGTPNDGLTRLHIGLIRSDCHHLNGIIDLHNCAFLFCCGIRSVSNANSRRVCASFFRHIRICVLRLECTSVDFFAIKIDIKCVTQRLDTARRLCCPVDGLAYLDPFVFCRNCVNRQRFRRNRNCRTIQCCHIPRGIGDRCSQHTVPRGFRIVGKAIIGRCGFGGLHNTIQLNLVIIRIRRFTRDCFNRPRNCAFRHCTLGVRRYASNFNRAQSNSYRNCIYIRNSAKCVLHSDFKRIFPVKHKRIGIRIRITVILRINNIRRLFQRKAVLIRLFTASSICTPCGCFRCLDAFPITGSIRHFKRFERNNNVRTLRLDNLAVVILHLNKHIICACLSKLVGICICRTVSTSCNSLPVAEKLITEFIWLNTICPLRCPSNRLFRNCRFSAACYSYVQGCIHNIVVFHCPRISVCAGVNCHRNLIRAIKSIFRYECQGIRKIDF